MTSRRGYTPRKQRLASTNQEEPLLVINCLCPLCDASFTPHQITGSYLDRRCPRCGAPLTTETYDKKAAETIAKHTTKKARAREIALSLEKLSKSIRLWKRWHLRPVYSLLHHRKQRLSTEHTAVQATTRALQQRLHALAKSRYYTSEWYLRTMIPAERTVVDPFHITMAYDESGTWIAHPSNAKEAGLIAEIQVAQVLFDRASDPSSPLYCAQVLPNIYLPHKNVRSNTSFWAQVDCILLTRQAAFIIEAKRHSTHVVMTPSHRRTIFSTRSEDAITQYREQNGPWRKAQMEALGFTTEESKALSQNTQHAHRFMEACPYYPHEKTYTQIVFVKPRSFDSPYDSFIEETDVSYLSTNEARFVDHIESVCATLPNLTTQKALDELGENLLMLYGDLNQKRGRLHELRLSRRDR